MRIVIFGATGMLGQALCQEARSRNAFLTGVARSEADVCLDIRDSKRVEETIVRLRPDVVINSAAITNLSTCEHDPGAAYLVNARPVSVMASACRQLGAYFVQISTDHYWVNDSGKAHSESDQVQLLNEYARSKYVGEAFALTNTDALVVRTNIVGFRRRGQQTFLEWVVSSLVARQPMTLFGDFYTSSIGVSAFAAALFALMERRPRGVLNLAASEVCSKKTFIELVADALSLDTAETVIGSVASIEGPVRANSLGLDVRKAESILGHRLPDARQVVATLAEEYRRMRL